VWKYTTKHIHLRARILLVSVSFNIITYSPDSNDHRNVGPFRYWTTSNIPLFLIAAPMFVVLINSSIWAFTSTQSLVVKETNSRRSPVLRNMAISQLLLALLTLTTAHVQIISRISSSFPVWVWYGTSLLEKKDGRLASVAVRYMVMYAIIQGGLFASFLPPA
jgi:phosphatidylinositol glycan class V